MNKYIFEIVKFGNGAELHRFIKNDNRTIVLPVISFSTIKSAKSAGKDWQQGKK